MQLLIDRITSDAKHLGNGVLKVDSFMNHQIDPVLMEGIGKEFYAHFKHLNPTRILTAETSGIAPAVAAGMFLKIPVVYARKHQPITMSKETFREISVSPTHGNKVELVVASEYLLASDRVLIIDDFLATAKTIKALMQLIDQSGATLVGIGAVIEKGYTKGRELLKDISVPVISLATVESYDGENVIVAKTK